MMPRRWSVKMVLIVLLLTASGWPREVFPNLGLSLEVPESWFVVPADSSLAQQYDGAALIASADPDDQCVLVISRSKAMGRSEDYLVASTVHYIYTKMFGAVLGEGKLDINGAEGYFLLYRGGFLKDDEAPRKYLRVFASKDDFFYTFHTSGHWDSFDHFEGMLLEMINSVEWNIPKVGTDNEQETDS